MATCPAHGLSYLRCRGMQSRAWTVTLSMFKFPVKSLASRGPVPIAPVLTCYVTCSWQGTMRVSTYTRSLYGTTPLNPMMSVGDQGTLMISHTWELKPLINTCPVPRDCLRLGATAFRPSHAAVHQREHIAVRKPMENAWP